MEFCLISQCTKDLEFTKYRKWPSPLPAVAFKKHLLCGFDRTDGPVVDKDSELPELLRSIYPELSLSELAHLFKVSQNVFTPDDREKILRAYGLKLNPDLMAVFEILPQTPSEFQDFVHHKKIGARELAPLRAVHSLTDISELLTQIALSPLSKSQNVNLLEMAIELYLMEFQILNLLKTENETAEVWLKRISGLRLPLTTKTDQEFAAKNSNLNWPNQVKAEWLRKGDISGLQISFFASSQNELRKKILALNKVNDELTTNPERLWTK